ncbi:MAG: hypothetical protein JW827_09965 [Spirochaetes bacterium]|nr:hypothetical protein [Spirochaetota bacterium]
MRRHELIGLFFAAAIIISTYLINYFYDFVSDIFNPNIVSARVNNKNDIDNNVDKVFSPLYVTTSKDKYYRYELVDIKARYQDLSQQPIVTGELTASVYKNSKIVETVGRDKEIVLKYNPKLEMWTAKWAIPWSPELGEYQLLVKASPDYPGPVLTATASFEIMGKNPPKRTKGFCAVLLEYGGDITGKQIIGPDGRNGNWNNIIQWVKYTGADAFFMLGGETETYNSKVDKENPFDPNMIRAVAKVAKAAKKEDLDFGAWIMSFGYQGKNCEKVGYAPSMGYNISTGKLYPSYMHISLSDQKRFDDLLDLVKKFDSNDDIDFIGIDYIRTGHLDGYELADDVVRDMNIAVPEDWESLSSTAKAVWFAKKIKADEDEDIVEQWRWWRAHKSATIVNRLIEYSGTKKPVWVFTLGWEHGKQHGQDPLMFTDAGVTYDAVMLYEANQVQFRQVLIDWKGYISSKQVNILVGESVDVKLLDSPYLSPPEEIVRRTLLGSKKITFGGMADGIFWHDISRALWGRKGVYSPREWFITAGKSFSEFRLEKGELEIKTSIAAPKKVYFNNAFNIVVNIENQSLREIRNIKTQIIDNPGIQPVISEVITPYLGPGETKALNFKISISPELSKLRSQYMLAAKSEWNHDQKSFDFKYVRGSKFYGSKE